MIQRKKAVVKHFFGIFFEWAFLEAAYLRSFKPTPFQNAHFLRDSALQPPKNAG